METSNVKNYFEEFCCDGEKSDGEGAIEIQVKKRFI
jgi:hypothetical protein